MQRSGLERACVNADKPVATHLKLLLRYLRPQTGRVALLSLLLAAGVALQLVSPQIVRFFIDTAVSGGESRSLTQAALLFIGIALSVQLVSVLTTYIGENVAWSATNALRRDLTLHCLSLDMSFHKDHRAGELIERIDGDASALSNFFTKLVVMVLANALLIAGMLALLFREDWHVGVALSAFAAMAVASLLCVQSLAVPFWVKVREIRAEFFGFVGEHVSGAADISSNGAVPHVMRRFYEILRSWLPKRLQADLVGYSMWMTSLAVFAIGHAIAFGVSGYLWSRGAITIGTAYLIFHYTNLLQGPVHQIRSQLEDLQKATASIKRMQELLSLRPAIKDGGGPPLSPGQLSLQFDSVSFAYDGDQQVLHDVTVSVPAGEVVGVLGRTGSGKTTLARLLARFYEPSSGRIMLGGRDISSVPINNLRQRVGIVSQDVQVFKATLRENVRLFDQSVTDEQVTDALDTVGLGEWLRSLPMGLDTVMERDGSGLSAGEAQLLALSRVFLRDPGLVVLDEASSRIDPATERLLQKAIDRLMSGRTGFIIAHRLSTLDRANWILILEGGRVCEFGRRESLAGDSRSRYSRLLRAGIEEVLR